MKLLLGFFIGLTLFGQTAHQIIFTVTDPQNPAGTLYNFYKLTGSCPAIIPTTISAAISAGFVKINTSPVALTTTFSDGAVTVGTTYCYLGTATNGTVESNPTLAVNAVGGPIVVLPFTPAISATIK